MDNSTNRHKNKWTKVQTNKIINGHQYKQNNKWTNRQQDRITKEQKDKIINGHQPNLTTAQTDTIQF